MACLALSPSCVFHPMFKHPSMGKLGNRVMIVGLHLLCDFSFLPVYFLPVGAYLPVRKDEANIPGVSDPTGREDRTDERQQHE